MDPIQSWMDPKEVRRLAEALISKPATPEEDGIEAGYGDEWVGYTDPGAKARPTASQPAEQPAPPEKPPAAPQMERPETPTIEERVQVQARQSLSVARQIADQGGLLATVEPAPEVAEAPPAAPAPRPAPEAPATAPVPVPVAPAAQPAPAPARPASPFVERLQRYGAWLHQSFRAKGFFVTNREGEVLIDEVRSPKLLQVARTLAHASRTANRQAGGSGVGSLHIQIGPDGILEVIPLTCRYGPLVLGLIVPATLPPKGVEAAAAGLQQVVDGTAASP